MSDEQTVWSQTLLENFISGMQKKPTDEWIKGQVRDLAERGMSVEYIADVLRKDVSDVAAERLMNVMNVAPSKGQQKGKKKKGFLGKFFS